VSASSTANLLTLATQRRSLLKGAAGASLAAAGAGLLTATPVWAQATTSPDSAHTIFSIARTAEQLAVTFYSGGVQNASALGLSAADLDSIKAALVEEQIHLYLFMAQGGDSLADTFSLPAGAKTFTDLATFITTQQLLEGAFDAAFIAAVLEFAQLGMPRVAQIACQIAMIESEHRALGRQIAISHNIPSLPNTFGVTDQGGLNADGTIPTDPADNWAFAPALVGSVGAAVPVLKKAGVLSPTAGNSYTYKPAIDQNGKDLLGFGLDAIYARLMFKTPFAVPETSASAPGPMGNGGAAPTELNGSASGSLVGNSGGAFVMYMLSKPSGKSITLTLSYKPTNAVIGAGVGLEVYQNGAKLGSSTDSNGSGAVTVTVTPSSSGVVLIKVDNYINGQAISYTLTQS